MEVGTTCALILISVLMVMVFSFGQLQKKDDGSFEVPVPRYSADKTQAVLWVENSLGPSVLALFKHYDDKAGDVLGKTFYAANAHITYPELAKILEKCQFSRFMRLICESNLFFASPRKAGQVY